MFVAILLRMSLSLTLFLQMLVAIFLCMSLSLTLFLQMFVAILLCISCSIFADVCSNSFVRQVFISELYYCRDWFLQFNGEGLWHHRRDPDPLPPGKPPGLWPQHCMPRQGGDGFGVQGVYVGPENLPFGEFFLITVFFLN